MCGRSTRSIIRIVNYFVPSCIHFRFQIESVEKLRWILHEVFNIMGLSFARNRTIHCTDFFVYMVVLWFFDIRGKPERSLLMTSQRVSFVQNTESFHRASHANIGGHEPGTMWEPCLRQRNRGGVVQRVMPALITHISMHWTKDDFLCAMVIVILDVLLY